MDFLCRMTKAIDYIESHLEEDIDMNDVAKIIYCSVYQFGRIFSYVVGIPLSEYIRRRRLSQAALALQAGDVKVIDTAVKYGYESADAFTRAFGIMHGVTPKEARVKGVRLRLYPRITFHITIKGATDMEYRIEEKGVIHGVGMVKNFGRYTANKEGKTWQERNGERWTFWDEFLDVGANLVIRDKYKLYRSPYWQIGVTHTNDKGETIEMIGAEAREGEIYPELTRFEVPAATWAVFVARGTLNQPTHPIEALVTRIVSEWFPSSGYERSMPYDIEIYGPGNTQQDDYECEIWIPVRKK